MIHSSKENFQPEPKMNSEPQPIVSTSSPAIGNTNVSGRFVIDFFEFSFLVEACIPPRPIARAMFWEDVINKHYHVLTENERQRLFTWITKNLSFDLTNEDCRLFYARFNPKNQYEVETEFEGKKETVKCFKWNDKFHLSKSKSVNEKYIVKANWLSNGC
jgi:hypothetical protein